MSIEDNTDNTMHKIGQSEKQWSTKHYTNRDSFYF
jgi:hypothetical protein